MKLCVFSYPNHFRVMQLAILQALQYLPVSTVEIFWDDMTSEVPNNLPWPVTGYSKVADVSKQPNGWLRQQYVKLNLHRVLTDDKWLTLDADTVLRNTWQFNSNQWYYDPCESSPDYWAFTKFALGIDALEQRYMTPLWLCEREVLVALSQELHQRHQDKLENIFENSKLATFSEVEMYAAFATQRMSRQYQLMPHNLRMITTDQFVDAWHNTSDNLCLGGADNFNPLFWKQWPNIIVDR